MKTKIMPVLLRIVTALSFIFAIWLILANIYSFNLSYPVLLIILALIIAGIFVPKTAITSFITRHPRTITTLIIIIIAAALAARLSFLKLEYAPTSDPANYYNSAIALAEDGTVLDPNYHALFPYLFSYDLILAGSMKIFGTGTIAIIILNTILDIIAAILLYLLVKKISHNQRQPALLAALLYFTSPFNIIFSAISLPIIAVNTLIIAAILIIYLAFKQIKNLKKLTALSLAAGITLSLVNAFRPFAIVFIIAIFIWYVLHLVKTPTKKSALHLGISFAAIAITFFAGNASYAALVSSVTKLPAINPANGAGWSLYVGSNYDSWGRWNTQDATAHTDISQQSASADATLAALKQKAIERYSSYSPLKLADHFVRKSIVLGGDQSHSIYNLDSYPRLWQSQTMRSFLYTICAIYTYFMIFFTAYFFYHNLRQKTTKPVFTHFICIAFLGLFCALLLVEVANRYFTPFFIFLAIFAALGITLSLASQAAPMSHQSAND